MKGDDIDDYIATFNRLLAKAGWDKNTQGTIEMFKSGLDPLTLKFILMGDTWPNAANLLEWQNAARNQAVKRNVIRQTLRNSFQKRVSTTATMAPQRANPRKQRPQRDPNAMDVDVARTNRSSTDRLSPEEVTRLRNEGRCFICKKQGHISKTCPDRKTPFKPRAEKGKAPQKLRNTEAQEEDEQGQEQDQKEPPAYDEKALAAAIKTMKAEERDAFFEKVLVEEDF